jgi:hypothetical protein
LLDIKQFWHLTAAAAAERIPLERGTPARPTLDRRVSRMIAD